MVHQKIVQTSQQYTGKEAHQKTTPSFMYTQYTHSPWREMGEQPAFASDTAFLRSVRSHHIRQHVRGAQVANKAPTTAEEPVSSLPPPRRCCDHSCGICLLSAAALLAEVVPVHARMPRVQPRTVD